MQEVNKIINDMLTTKVYVDEKTGVEMYAGRPRYEAHHSGYMAFSKVPADLPFEPLHIDKTVKAVAGVGVTPASAARVIALWKTM